jgi:aryl-alcohol dehydrogenase-like predicted oxidoreductase
MNRRVFGPAGRAVGEVGLGCWQLGGADWGDVSDEQAMETLQAAVDHGVDFFDTADVYGLGRSEELIGKFLRAAQADVFVATKLGRFPEPGWPGNFTREAVRAHTEASLKRLGRETLDLTQFHCIPTEVMARGEVFEWLRELRAEGKIRYFGASVESMEEALLCLKQEGLASLQIIFNIFRQKPIETLFDAAKAQNVALIVRVPLASGLLSGKMRKDTHFASTDHRNYNRDGQAFNVGETFAGLPYELGVDLADRLKADVPTGMTMAQFALRWILDYDAVSVVIPGAKDPAQVAANTSVSDLPPHSPELHEKLRGFYASSVAEHIRGPY